ncbi:MAG: hypothetical protein WBZ57_22780, partial [Pseudomonas graminis]
RMLWRRWGVLRFDMMILSFDSKVNDHNESSSKDIRQGERGVSREGIRDLLERMPSKTRHRLLVWQAAEQTCG